MSLKKVHDKQPDDFEFTKENLETANRILKNYPKEKKKSAEKIILFKKIKFRFNK